MCQGIIISSVVPDKHSAAQLLRGTTADLPIKKYEEATTAREQLDYKHWESVRTVQSVQSGQGGPVLIQRPLGH